MLEEILLHANFEEFIFKVTVKNDYYQEERRKRYTLVNVERVNYEVENKPLLEYISQFD